MNPTPPEPRRPGFSKQGSPNPAARMIHLRPRDIVVITLGLLAGNLIGGLAAGTPPSLIVPVVSLVVFAMLLAVFDRNRYPQQYRAPSLARVPLSIVLMARWAKPEEPHHTDEHDMPLEIAGQVLRITIEPSTLSYQNAMFASRYKYDDYNDRVMCNSIPTPLGRNEKDDEKDEEV